MITAGLFSIFCAAVSIALAAPPLPLLWGPWEASWWEAVEAVRAYITQSGVYVQMEGVVGAVCEAVRPVLDGTIRPALGHMRGLVLGMVSH